MVCWKGKPAKFIPPPKKGKYFTEKIKWTFLEPCLNFIQLLPNMINSVVHTFTSVQVVSSITTERCLLLREPYLFHWLDFIILSEVVMVTVSLNINQCNVFCSKELNQCRLCILHRLCVCTLIHFHGCNSGREWQNYETWNKNVGKSIWITAM
jgi:hypothetical protein